MRKDKQKKFEYILLRTKKYFFLLRLMVFSDIWVQSLTLYVFYQALNAVIIKNTLCKMCFKFL